VTDLLIDGDIFVADGGGIVRFVGGKSEGWTVQPAGFTSDTPDGDTLLRTSPVYSLIASASDKRTGVLYAWDRDNARVVAIDKAKGTFIEQYRLAGANPGWSDVRGMYVVLGAGPEAPSTLIWATKDSVMNAVLERVPDSVAPSPSGSPGPAGSGALGSAPPSAAPSAKPSTKP